MTALTLAVCALPALVLSAVEPQATMGASASASGWTALVVNDLSSSDSVSPIATATNTAASPVAVGNIPLGVAVAPSGTMAYVVNAGPNTLTPIDLTTSPPTPETAVPDGAGVSGSNWIAITPDGTRAFVTAPGSAQVVPFDLTTTPPTAETPISMGTGGALAQPEGIAITPDGHTAYVAATNQNWVVPIDLTTTPPTVGNPLTTGFDGPFGIAITPNGQTAYVTNLNGGSVTPINLTTSPPTVETAITVGASPHWVAITPDGQTALVTNNGSGTVTPIATSTNTAGAPITVNGAPYAIAVAPDGRTAYETDGNGSTVTPIDLTTTPPTPGTAIRVGSDPRGIAITPDQGPEAGFSVTPQPPGSATSFDASVSQTGVGTITSYAWTFGDGTSTVTGTPATTHTYATAKTYTATLTVTNSAGTSLGQVFTGQTVSQNGGPAASTTRTFDVAATEPAAPQITGVSPAGGPTAGGTTVTVSGANLTGVTSVAFGPISATGFSINGAGTQLFVPSPPLPAGTVDVTATGPGGTSTTGAADQFTYSNRPTVTAVVPSSGPTSGGTPVTISGTNLAGATVDFGAGHPATNVVVNTPGTQLTAVSPAGSGTVDVTATTLAGTSATSTADHFNYGLGSISGHAVDGSGTPLSGAIVVACTATTCDRVTTDSSGAFLFDNLADADYGVTAFPAANNLVPETSPVTITGGQNVTGLVLTDPTVSPLKAGVSLSSPTFGTETSTTGVPRLFWQEPTQVSLPSSDFGGGAVVLKQSYVNGTSLFGGNALTETVNLGGTLDSPAGALALGQTSTSYTVPPVFPIHGSTTISTGYIQYPEGQAPPNGVAAPLSLALYPDGLTAAAQFVNYGSPGISVGGGTLVGGHAQDFRIVPLHDVTGAIGQQTDCGSSPSFLFQDTVYATLPPADTRCAVAVTWLHPAGVLVESTTLEEQTGQGLIPVLITACDDTVLACSAIDSQDAVDPDEPDEPNVVIGHDINGYVDPSGTVMAHTPSGTFPAANATVTLLQQNPSTLVFAPVPSGSVIMSPDNRVNPAATAASGEFGWDTLPGTYQLTAGKTGCTPNPITSGAIVVPPPATGIVLTLNCPSLVRAPSETGLLVSPTAPAEGQSVTLTAGVTSTGTVPSGTVTFRDGTTVLGTVALDQLTGRAQLTTSVLSPGTHTIRALYSGDGNDAPSSAVASLGVKLPTLKVSGYQMVATDGGVFYFGRAGYFGSLGGTHLNRPIVGMATTPDGKGYWLVASDGGIFPFGDAKYLGSTGDTHLNRPIVGMATTPDGKGYWLVASDGGIFPFGDAKYLGSTGDTHLNRPIVGMDNP